VSCNLLSVVDNTFISTHKFSNRCQSFLKLQHMLSSSYFTASMSFLVPAFRSCSVVAGTRFFSSSADQDDNNAAADQFYYRQYEKLFGQNVDAAASHSSETRESTTRPPTADSDVSAEQKVGDSATAPRSEPSLSHVDAAGGVKMVDVGSKPATHRVAIAVGRVTLGDDAFQLVAKNQMKKGNVLVTAQLAGIMAAKRTCGLIPLCHHVALTSVDVELQLAAESRSVEIRCTASTSGQTGVEMEALTGVAVAGLTVYDMCKSVSHDIVIGDIKLQSKTGGKSNYRRR
jgi:molybdenum cofactor biosynthesis protein MoaC